MDFILTGSLYEDTKVDDRRNFHATWGEYCNFYCSNNKFNDYITSFLIFKKETILCRFIFIRYV